MSHLLLPSAQHLPGEVIKINPWQHCVMIQCDVCGRWPSLAGSRRRVSPYCITSPTHHGLGHWRCGHGDTDWFCSPRLTVSDSSITLSLIAGHPQVASRQCRRNILRFPCHGSDNNLGMVWRHPSGITQHLHRKKKKKKANTRRKGRCFMASNGIFLLLWEMFPQWNYYLMSCSPLL